MPRLSHFFGGILLVAGTAIGAGMLALPVLTCFAGFIPTIFLLGATWLYLLVTALLFLEVNLAIPGEINLITMAEKRLGLFGKVISWTAYLLLLYCLTSAYLAGGAPLFAQLIERLFDLSLPSWLEPFPFLIFLGFFVYLGTKSVDFLNRIFMTGLIVTFILLVFFLPPFVEMPYLRHIDGKAIFVAIPLVVTSFGFHIVIPTLTTYLRHNRVKLQWVIFIGSTIPLLAYILWEFLMLGSLPLDVLATSWIEKENVTKPLTMLHKPWLGNIAHTFSFFAILTSFLGVSLSLTDFLRDGLRLKRTHKGRATATILTFLPPLFFVLYYPKGFIAALQYGAIFVAILLGILPALMAWSLPQCKSFFKKLLLITVILVSLFVIVIDLLEEAGELKKLVSNYVTQDV